MIQQQFASLSVQQMSVPGCGACSITPSYRQRCCSPQACLPQLYQAVQIGEDFYWDGGYTGNPALAPLYLGTDATDVIVVGVNPIERTSVPQTARAIIDRIDEISFNSTFMLELGAIAFVEKLMQSATVQAPVRLLYVHGIGDETLGAFGASSKMNNEWGFLQHLQEVGWRATDRWLAENLAAIGNRSTLDLSGLAPAKDGLLTSPSFREQTHVSTSYGRQDCLRLNSTAWAAS